MQLEKLYLLIVNNVMNGYCLPIHSLPYMVGGNSITFATAKRLFNVFSHDAECRKYNEAAINNRKLPALKYYKWLHHRGNSMMFCAYSFSFDAIYSWNLEIFQQWILSKYNRFLNFSSFRECTLADKILNIPLKTNNLFIF